MHELGDVRLLLFQCTHVGHNLKNLVLRKSFAERLHRARRAPIDDLEHTLVGRKSWVVMRIADEARADPAAAIRQMAGLAVGQIQILALG